MPYLILVSIVWGFSFVIIKGTLVSLDASFVSLARLLLSLLVFLPFLRFAGLSLHEKLQLLLIGGIQFGLMYIAYVAAFQYLPAHVIALLTTTTPLFVAVFNDILTGKVHKRFFFAAALAVAGGVIIELPDRSLEAGMSGIVLIQLSNAAFALGQLAYKKWMASRPNIRDVRIFALLYAGAVLVAGAFSLATTDYRRLCLQPHQGLALFYLGVVASGICFFLWNKGACRVNEGVLAVMNNLKIPIGVAASLFLLQEVTDYMRLLLGSILFAGALWINRRHS